MARVIGVVADTHIPDRLAEVPPRALQLLAENEVQTIQLQVHCLKRYPVI